MPDAYPDRSRFLTEDELIGVAHAWADYREAYGLGDAPIAHPAFVAGWTAKAFAEVPRPASDVALDRIRKLLETPSVERGITWLSWIKDGLTASFSEQLLAILNEAEHADRIAAVAAALPEKPGSIIVWQDGAYLPQLAQLDAGSRRLGWRYQDDTGGYWFTPAELAARIGDDPWTLLGPLNTGTPAAEGATR